MNSRTPPPSHRLSPALLEMSLSPEGRLRLGQLYQSVPNIAAFESALDKLLPKKPKDLDLPWLKEENHSVITLFDPDYPELLRTIPDPPLILWLAGQRTLLQDPAVAIVGSRNASDSGLRDAQDMAQALGQKGLTIISGLARGIDSAAHQGALDTVGGTIAILGHGPDRIYPSENRGLAQRIREKGLLVSEYPPGTPLQKEHLPARSRLVSGLSLGVVVIEATLYSGALTTSRSALNQGREVMALPGSVHSPLKKGCHALIRQGATLVETAQDVLSHLHSPLRRLHF